MKLLLQYLKNVNVNIMKDLMKFILTLLNICQIFLNTVSAHDKEECFINSIDLSQDQMLCGILDDVLPEDSINGINDDIFYDINVSGYKTGVMVSVSRLSKNFIYKDKDCLGFSDYKGKFVMINGEGMYLTGVKHVEDSIRVRCERRDPVPDGIKSWTYKIEDGLCTRFFKGMGFMLVREFKHPKDSMDRIHVVSLPIRKTNNIKR